jgi:hypothetical protein
MTDSNSNTMIFVKTAENKAADAITRAAAPAAPQRCRPFFLSVMVFSPEAGYKFEIEIEKSCNSSNEPEWSLIFNLAKKIDDRFESIVEIKYISRTSEEADGITKIAKNGFSENQLNTVNSEVYPTAKTIGNEDRSPTSIEKDKINKSMRKVVITN